MRLPISLRNTQPLIHIHCGAGSNLEMERMFVLYSKHFSRQDHDVAHAPSLSFLSRWGADCAARLGREPSLRTQSSGDVSAVDSVVLEPDKVSVFLL